MRFYIFPETASFEYSPTFAGFVAIILSIPLLVIASKLTLFLLSEMFSSLRFLLSPIIKVKDIEFFTNETTNEQLNESNEDNERVSRLNE